MGSSLRKNMIGSKNLAVFTGICFHLSWLGCALASEAEAGHELNWLDFGYRTAAFVIVVGLLYKLLKKPIASFLDSRREEIQRLLAELDAKTAETRTENERVQARLVSMAADARKIVDELIAEGETEKQKIIEAARKEAEYIQQQAQIAIQQEIQVARDTLKDEVADLSIAAAQDLIRKKMRAEDQQRLVQEFMTKVVEAK